MVAVSDVRPSPIAGTWYSGDAQRLRRQVETYLSEAHIPSLNGDVVAVVAPHAGHRYSGRTAGHAFAAVRGQSPEVVAVLSPFHAMHPAELLTTAHQAYATPLGLIPVDHEDLLILEQDLAEQHLSLTRVAYDSEHSLEIELPFLQVALQGDFRLLPLMVRSHSPQVLQTLGKLLAQVLKDRRALLVASTDLSHFYPEKIARQLDAEMLRRLEAFDPLAMLEAETTGKGFACGVGAVAATLWAARALGADRVSILHHSTSADETGDYSAVVGYGAAAILRTV